MRDKRLTGVKNLHAGTDLVRGGLAYVSASYADTDRSPARPRSCRVNRARGGRARRRD